MPRLAAFRKAIVLERKIMYCISSYYFKCKYNNISWNSVHIKISSLFLFWNGLVFPDSWKSEAVPDVSSPILKL